MSEYTKTLKDLNAEQRRAVETIDGPLLVVAGPGTGKTQLLSTRVAYILKNTETRPGNILCLSFTNKAAINMRGRIVGLAGATGAKVQTRTFHSFAAEIMNQHPDYFWNAARLSVAPESVSLDIIESIVAKLPLNNPLSLKFAGQYTLLNDIYQSIALAKDAGLTPGKLRALIHANLAYIDLIEPKLVKALEPRLSAKALPDLAAAVAKLPTQSIDGSIRPLRSLSGVITESLDQAIALDEESGKTTNCSRWKRRFVQIVDGQKGMFDERRRNDWWFALSEIYSQYRAALHERGFYDYADMLVEVIAQLEQNPEVLADVQERYQYVMIDEFQDTNPAQLRLAHLVADHVSANDAPNLMAVGDDDQAIFRFQGAELNNMLGFRRDYPTAKIIVLKDNYRSTQSVLDSAKKIIEQAEVRLVKADKSLDKNLVAVAPPRAGQIKAVVYSSRELQLSDIARQIKARYKPSRTMAVLARSHDSLLRMTSVLQGLKVPVRYEQQSNILEHEIVELTYRLMKLCLAIGDGDESLANALIHQIIRAPCWGIEPAKLWQLALDNSKQPHWLDTLAKSGDKKLAAIGQWFMALSMAASSQPLPITIEQILGLRPLGDFTSPIKSYFTRSSAGTAEYFHALSAMQLLRALVLEFTASSSPRPADFTRFIEVNRANHKIIADESPFVNGTDAVQLLTVHKAKGLEFDEVFIIDAVEDNWQPRAGSRKPPANLPLQPVGDDMDDYVRLMYVAATRAKSSLTLSAYRQDHAGKDVAVSPILLAAFEVAESTGDKNLDLVEVLEENLRWPSLSGVAEKQILKARLEEYSLSVTHLINFLDVTRGGPAYFKERNLLRLPEAKSTSLSFGTAIHDSLEAAQVLTNRGQFNLSKVQKAFAASLAREQLISSELVRQKTKGEKLLAKLFKDFGYALPKGSHAEQKLRDIKLGTARLNGKLDRVDLSENEVTIVDYKTGRPLPSFTTTDQNLALKVYKHRLQLIFYALIAELSPRYMNRGDIECQMVYVEATSPKALVKTYQPSREEIDKLAKLIEIVWQKIQNLDLPDTSHYSPEASGVAGFEADLLAGKI